MLAMGREEVYRSLWAKVNLTSGRGLGGPEAQPGECSQAAQHRIEIFRVAAHKLQARAAAQIGFRVHLFNLLPEPALHALQVKGAAVARIERLRRAQSEPVMFHKNFVVPLR